MYPIYLHGKDSSPDGFRAQYLRARFPEILIPALTPDGPARRAEIDEILVDDALLIGSSLGGLSALDTVQRQPGRVAAMVLLAPAVGFFEAVYRTPEIIAFVESLIIPAGLPTTVIAGRRDEVIPLASIEALVARSPEPEAIEFHVVEDDHGLRTEEALDLMVSAVHKYKGTQS